MVCSRNPESKGLDETKHRTEVCIPRLCKGWLCMRNCDVHSGNCDVNIGFAFYLYKTDVYTMVTNV